MLRDPCNIKNKPLKRNLGLGSGSLSFLFVAKEDDTDGNSCDDASLERLKSSFKRLVVGCFVLDQGKKKEDARIIDNSSLDA